MQKKDTGKETGDDKKNGDAKKTGDDKKKTDTKDTDAKKTDKAEGKKNTGGKKKTDDKKNTGGKKDTTKKDQDKVTAKEVPSSSSGLNVAPGGQAVGSDLPAPSVDAGAACWWGGALHARLGWGKVLVGSCACLLFLSLLLLMGKGGGMYACWPLAAIGSCAALAVP